MIELDFWWRVFLAVVSFGFFIGASHSELRTESSSPVEAVVFTTCYFAEQLLTRSISAAFALFAAVGRVPWW